MEEQIIGFVMFLVFACIVAAPFVGGYLGWKNGQRDKLEARKRQMRTKLMQGQVDGRLLREVVTDMRDDGEL